MLHHISVLHNKFVEQNRKFSFQRFIFCRDKEKTRQTSRSVLSSDQTSLNRTNTQTHKHTNKQTLGLPKLLVGAKNLNASSKGSDSDFKHLNTPSQLGQRVTREEEDISFADVVILVYFILSTRLTDSPTSLNQE